VFTKDERSAAAANTTPTSGPLKTGWRVGTPQTFGNLTLFPVISEETPNTDEFITLDEGLRSGKVIVAELDSDGRRVRNRQSAEVNQLSLVNNSGKLLILIAGEMVIGGKQDRMVGHDCIVESNSAPVPLDVFCVEHGRWSDAGFGQSLNVESRSGSGSGTGGTAGFTAAGDAMAEPKVREKAQAEKSQSGVWSGVAETVSANATRTATGTLNSVYEDKNVKGKLGDYERVFKTRFAGPNVVGVVVAFGGRITAADVFGSASLFRAYWPKLLKSYALAALGAPKSEKTTPDISAAEAFLARVEGGGSSVNHGGGYRLVEHQSPADASFELESTATASPLLIHFNRVSKR